MILEIDNIELNFKNKQILHGIYLKVETGKVTSLLGRNGSGKTCLLRIIFGSLVPKYKNIRLNGAYQKKELYKTNCIAYLPQHQLLPKTITLSYAFKLFGADWEEFVTIFNSFKPYKKLKTNELSSGELRIIETYLILTMDKEIIILDEPFSFIAPLYVEKIKALIQEKKKSCALLISDHFYCDILAISDTTYLLKNGSSKLITSKEELKNEGYLGLLFE